MAPGKHICLCKNGYIGDGYHCDGEDAKIYKIYKNEDLKQTLCFTALCPGSGTPNAISAKCLTTEGCPTGYFCEKALCCPIPGMH